MLNSKSRAPQNFVEECLVAAMADHCPPAKEYYLCNRQEEDSLEDCGLCWLLFMRNHALKGAEAFAANRRLSLARLFAPSGRG